MKVKILQQFKILRADVVKTPSREDKLLMDVFLKGEKRDLTAAQIKFLKDNDMASYIAPLSAVEETPVDDSGIQGDLSTMSVRELRAYAQNNDIDVSGLKKKDDILAAIDLAQEPGDAPSDAPGDDASTQAP